MLHAEDNSDRVRDLIHQTFRPDFLKPSQSLNPGDWETTVIGLSERVCTIRDANYAFKQPAADYPTLHHHLTTQGFAPTRVATLIRSLRKVAQCLGVDPNLPLRITSAEYANELVAYLLSAAEGSATPSEASSENTTPDESTHGHEEAPAGEGRGFHRAQKTHYPSIPSFLQSALKPSSDNRHPWQSLVNRAVDHHTALPHGLHNHTPPHLTPLYHGCTLSRYRNYLSSRSMLRRHSSAPSDLSPDAGVYFTNCPAFAVCWAAFKTCAFAGPETGLEEMKVVVVEVKWGEMGEVTYVRRGVNGEFIRRNREEEGGMDGVRGVVVGRFPDGMGDQGERGRSREVMQMGVVGGEEEAGLNEKGVFKVAIMSLADGSGEEE